MEYRQIIIRKRTNETTAEWVSSGYVNSDDQGYIEYDFTPGCSPEYEIGPHLWRGGTSGDVCFFDNTSDNFSLSIEINLDMI